MDIGIGYPGMFPGVKRDLLVEWATRSEAAGFTCLTAGDRLADSCNDMVVSMATIGAVTSTIRLMSTVMILPLHETALIAKQVASLDVLTGGRFTLGVGTGNRSDDFQAAERAYIGRTARFEEQLVAIKRYWRDGVDDGKPAVGPVPVTAGGPKVLIGPTTERAAERVVLADGIVTFGRDVETHAMLHGAAQEAWDGAGRAGELHFAAGMFFGIGDDFAHRAIEHLSSYYDLRSAQQIFDRFTLQPAAVVETVEAFEAAGVDEFYLCPLIAELDQIDRLVDLLSSVPGRSLRGV